MGDPKPQETTDLLQQARPTWRTVLLLAWPVLVQQGLTFAVNLSDRLLTGLFEHDVAYLSAQTTAGYLSWFISSYTLLVNVGSTALVARFLGGGNRVLAVRVMHQALLLAVSLGLAGSVVGLASLDGLMWLLQLRGPTAVFAAGYLRPMFTLLTFQMLEMAGLACLVGAGDTRPMLWVLGGVSLVNLPLAWGFYALFGFVGIALGTAVSHLLGSLAVLVLLWRGRAGLRLELALLRPDWQLLWRLLRLSVPAGLDSLSAVLCQFWFLSIVNGLGDEASSAHGIALTWEALGYLSGAAFGTAAMTLLGWNLGRGDPRQAARSGWTALLLGGGVVCVMGAVFFVLAPEMFALFCAQQEKHGVIAVGVPVLRLVAFAMPAMACTTILTPALRGAGDTRVPVLITWTGFLLVRIPLAYLLTGLELGLFGAWLAMFADLMVRGALLLARFAGGRWQRMRV
jgi:putative MATE family efflux protein